MKILRWFVGVLLLPACWLVTRVAMSLAQEVHAAGDGVFAPTDLALGGGFVLWLVVFYVLPSPMRTYILAHELTHALWGLLMGARISKISVAKDHGSVALSKTNCLIALAPYFFPLYTMIVIGVYAGLSLRWDMNPYRLPWLALVGFTWGFHFSFTITTLLQYQSDIHDQGYLFSYALIYLFNVAGICIWIAVVSGLNPARVRELAIEQTRELGRQLEAGYAFVAGNVAGPIGERIRSRTK